MMRVKIYLEFVPRLFCAALGALLMLLLAAGLWWQQTDKINEGWLVTYGQGIASMAAKSAVDATLNHDLVSLQVVLQDALSSARVSFVTLHDVENNLLVQAGTALSRHEIVSTPNFSAPISFQQNIAGYVTVYLEVPKANRILLFAFYIGILLLLTVAFLSLIEVWPRVIQLTQSVSKQEDPMNELDSCIVGDTNISEGLAISGDLAIPDDLAILEKTDTSDGVERNEKRKAQEGDALLTSNSVPATSVRASAKAVLQIEGFDKLKSTVSADFATKLEQQWLVLADTARLIYGGEWETPPEDMLENGLLVANFSSAQSDIEALRTASFFAQIIKNIFLHGKIAVDIRVVIALQEQLANTNGFPNVPFSLHLTQQQADALQPRLTLTALADGWWKLLGFDPAYQELLQKQSSQLQT